jgi:beta-xylosidase
MVKQILILLIILVINSWVKASNNGETYIQVNNQSPAVRNFLKFNYEQLSSVRNNNQVSFSDDFNLPQLRSLWQSNLNESEWSLNERPGFLRIKAQKISTIDELNIKNSFLQEVKNNTSGEAVCFIDITNLSEDLNAGIYFSSKRINCIGIETKAGTKSIFVSVNNEVYYSPAISENSVTLRIKIENARGWFEYSFDGLIYYKLGSEFKLSSLSNNTDYIGLFCYKIHNENGYVDFDWFYFNPIRENEIKFAEIENKILYPEL